MASKKTKKPVDINLIPFHKLKDIFVVKPEEKDKSPEETEAYDALNKISKVIDNALFPIFSFEPSNDIRKISNITSKRDKNKERKKEMQQRSLKTKILIKNTFYQAFESVSQCFAYREHSFGSVVYFIKFSNDTMKNMKTMEQPAEKSSHPFNMPAFLAAMMAFKKIERKTMVTHGIFMKRLTSNPGKPIIDRPIMHYKRNYYQTLILYKNINNKQINQKRMVDYMISWESNAPSIIDYRFFLLSNEPFFHDRLIQYYTGHNFNSVSDFYYDFVFIHRPYYCGEKSMGFLSSRWILPIDMNMMFSASEIGNFSTIHQDNIVMEQSYVIKLNFNLKENNKYIAKVFELYDIINDQNNVKYNIELNDVADIHAVDSFYDKTITDDITFSPSMDFNHKEISINVKNFDVSQTSNSDQDIRAHNGLLIQKQLLLHQRSEMIRKNKVLSSNNNETDIFPNIKYSHDLQDKRNADIINNYDRRLMIQEMMHQWSRDMVAIDFVKQYLIKIDEELMPLNHDITHQQISLLHESVCKLALLNEFDLIHLNIDYVSTNKIDDMILPTKMSFNSLPLTVDDVMYQYFMFLTHLYNNLLMNKKIDDIFIKTETNYDMIIKILHTIPAGNVIKWVTIWLIIEEIPFYSGFDVSKADSIFNRRFLPILYNFECLPIKRSEMMKLNCFDKKIYSNDDYIWKHQKKIYKNMGNFIHHQVDLGKLLITKLFHVYNQKKSHLDYRRYYDPKRYYIFENLAFFEHNNALIKKLFSINTENINNHIADDFYDIIKKLSYIKENAPSDVIFQIQNMIDFHMSCINQYNSFMSYLIIKGNNFIEKRQDMIERKKSPLQKRKAGGAYNADLVHYEEIYGYAEVEPDVFYLDEIITMTPRDIENKPIWLYMYNRNLEKLEVVVKDVKQSLNQYRRPDVGQLEFLNDIITRVYLRQENNRIPERCIPVVDRIIQELNILIINDYNIDLEHLKVKIMELNEMIADFIDAYAIDYFGLDLSNDRLNYKNIEGLTPEKLWDVPKRKKIMMRFMFFKEYITQQYEIIRDLYDILDIVRFDMVGTDNLNTMQRLNHSLYSVNNFINQEMPVHISKKHEVITRNITLKGVDKDKIYESLMNRKTIVELNNFRYLFKTQSSGIRYAPTTETSYPSIKIIWSIVIKNQIGDLSEIYDDEIITRINPLDNPDGTQNEVRANQYKVALPYLKPSLVQFILDNGNCVLYADLQIFLLKPQISQEELQEEYTPDLVVYPSLSLVGSKLTVLDDDVLNISRDNVYERINRFNNYLYLNQPDELLFFHANVMQHYFD